MKKYNVMVKVLNYATNTVEWKAVRPTHGTPYVWTKEEAEKYVETYDTGRGALKIQEV